MVQDADWREFERLVARVERALAPRGAVVRSPDRLPDLLTGSLREVDASIRFTVGSAPVLVTIECRRRSAVQDDRWIEELATKKEKLGAAKTIAVSASGFSEPAKITAKHKGIDLRKLREVTDEEIISWMRSVTLTKVGCHSKLAGMFAELDQAGPVVNYRIEPELPSGGIRALIRVADNKFVSPYDILMTALRSDPNLLGQAPLYESKERRVVTAVLPSAAIKVQTSNGPRPIRSISFELDCWRQTTSEVLTSGTHYAYADTDRTIVQGAEFRTEIGGIPFVLHIQLVPGSKPPAEPGPQLPDSGV